MTLPCAGCRSFFLNSHLSCSSLSSRLDLPLPEMVFGEACLSLVHEPSGFKLTFTAEDALARVDNTPEGNVLRVAHAKYWPQDPEIQNRGRGGSGSPSMASWSQEEAKHFDWTYTTDYTGSLGGSVHFTPTTEQIDYPRLQERGPILWYGEGVLFEDELGDNGGSMLSVRARVMPWGFLILQRFFLHVDHVLYRIRDTRIYHVFHSDTLLMEKTVREVPYAQVKAKLLGGPNKARDAHRLTDPNWVLSVLPPEAEGDKVTMSVSLGSLSND